MKKRLFLLISVFLLLSGCSIGKNSYTARPCSNDPAEIAVYSLPRSYVDTDELCIPANRESSSALIDCNGDGIDELIVCTHSESSRVSEVSLNVFSAYKDGYKKVYSEVCEGRYINSLSFAHFSDGTCGIVFEYSLTDSGLHEVLICSFSGGYPDTVYQGVCDRLSVFDIDNNGIDEILLADTGSETDCGTVSMFTYKGGRIIESSKASLSAGLTKIEAASSGNVGFNLPAFLCEGYIKGIGYVTDCIICRDDKLENISCSGESFVSENTSRPVCIWSRDADGDGCMEIPKARRAGSDDMWFIDWLRPSPDGNTGIICTTFNDFASGWSLKMPDGMGQNLTAEVTVDQDDTKCTLFSFVSDEGEEHPALWAVYEFIGDDAAERMHGVGITPAGAAGDRVFAIAFYSTVYDYQYTGADLASGFFISSEHIFDFPGFDDTRK